MPNPFNLLNLASTVGVLAFISLAICLKDFLPSCINALIIAISVLSSSASKEICTNRCVIIVMGNQAYINAQILAYICAYYYLCLMVGASLHISNNYSQYLCKVLSHR